MLSKINKEGDLEDGILNEKKELIKYDREKELRILSILPQIVNWIQTNRKFTDEEIKIFCKLYPEQYEFAVNSTFDEIFEMNSRHQESKIYGKYIEVVQSPKGIQWVGQVLSRVKELHKRSIEER